MLQVDEQTEGGFKEAFFGLGITNFISSLKKIFLDGSFIILLFILNLLSRIRLLTLVRLIVSSLFLMKISFLQIVA